MYVETKAELRVSVGAEVKILYTGGKADRSTDTIKILT